MCKAETADMTARTINGIQGGQEPDQNWRTEVMSMLALILTRVTGVEDVVQGVVAGMATLARDRQGKGRNSSEDVCQQTSGNTVLVHDEHNEHVDVAAANPGGGGQHCESPRNDGDMSEDTTTPMALDNQAKSATGVSHKSDGNLALADTTQRAMEKQSTAATGGSHIDKAENGTTPATGGLTVGEPNAALLVNLDSLTSQSGNSAPFEVRRRPPRTTPRLLHTQPRMRAVPCARQLPCTPAAATNGEGRRVATPNPIHRAVRYKDPPGYNDATDFGVAYTPILKPPKLQPRTNGVSCHPPPAGWLIVTFVKHGV